MSYHRQGWRVNKRFIKRCGGDGQTRAGNDQRPGGRVQEPGGVELAGARISAVTETGIRQTVTSRIMGQTVYPVWALALLAVIVISMPLQLWRAVREGTLSRRDAVTNTLLFEVRNGSLRFVRVWAESVAWRLATALDVRTNSSVRAHDSVEHKRHSTQSESGDSRKQAATAGEMTKARGRLQVEQVFDAEASLGFVRRN